MEIKVRDDDDGRWFVVCLWVSMAGTWLNGSIKQPRSMILADWGGKWRFLLNP